MKHTITKENLVDFEVRHSIASSFGKGARKRLDVVVKNETLRYEVFNLGHRVSITTCLVGVSSIFLFIHFITIKSPSLNTILPPYSSL